MSKRVKAAKPDFAGGLYTGMFCVEGRLFRLRADAVAYCKAQRLPAWKIGTVPPLPGEADPVKLSAGEGWRLRSYFDGPEPILIFEHANGVHAFAVPMADLVDLVTSVKARIRELAKAVP